MIQQLLIVLIAGLIIYYPYLPEKIKNKLAVLSNGSIQLRLNFVNFVFFSIMYNIPMGILVMILFFTIQNKNTNVEQ